MKTILLFLMIVMATLVPAHAQEVVMQEVISVSADAEAKGAPDKVDVSLGLSEQNVKLEDARARVDAQLDALYEIAEEMDIEKDDLQTSYSSVQPVYNYRDNEREFKGYQVTHNITVTLRDTDKLATFTNKVLEAKIDEIHNIQFGLENQDALVNEALQKAVAKAKAKADALAGAAGVKVGQVISLNEGTQMQMPRPMMRMEMSAMASADKVASAPPGGSISVNATVSVVYELQR